jgi:hypothetical protein
VLFGTWKYKNRGVIIVGVLLALFYFIVAGCIPAYNIQKSYKYGDIYVGLYAHVFRYAQFFGWLTILLLIPPVLFLRSHILKRPKNRWLLLGIILVFSILTWSIAFRSANIAPFGVKPEILNDCPQLGEHFTKDRPPTMEENKNYQEMMQKLHENRGNWSTARYLYYVSVFMQMLNMFLIFFVANMLCLHGWTSNDAQSYEFKGALLYCSLAILVAYIWLLLRVAFVQQKTKYFPDVSNLAGDYIVMVIFLVVTLSLVIFQLSWILGKYTFIIGLIPFFLGIFSLLSSGSGLVSVFGMKVGPTPYRTGLVAICSLLVTFFILVYMLEDESKDRRLQSLSKPPSS